MTQPIMFGDAEAAAVDILTLAGLGATVAVDLVGYTAGSRWLRIARTGGIPTLWMQLDNAAIAASAYGPDKAAAHDLAVAARTALFAARGVYIGNGLRVVDVADSDGLAWDVTEPDPHYTFSVVLVTRPA